ncbi:MAG: GH3 auxin-responsive promoter family protein [Bacteroidales bacterium]|nr:GH3 auxin-responsive promoter family protein [Bacteroidales bacterium]
MSITRIIRPFFNARLKAIGRYETEAKDIQLGVLARLLADAAGTQWAAAHRYAPGMDYDRFAERTPISTYDDFKDDIDRMRRGEADVLCKGRVKWYAKSSGTTNDKSKFIPVSARYLRDTHYAGGTDAVALYLRNNPKSRLFDGRALILGGSHAPNYNLPHSLVGDLSSILIENINPLVNLVRTPSKKVALLSDFEEKRDRIAAVASRQNVTNLSGVPSWMMAVLNRVIEFTGKPICEVWPNLEVFFHGGVAFTPYREQYRRLIANPGMHYMETYNASEGFFGLQDDPADPAMLLMIDYGVFYEFIPLEDVGMPEAQAVPLWEVETGRNYAMVITTTGGLWRYMIGDTVRFTQADPYKFVITGRTKSFINAFGEELIVDNAERGLQAACAATGAQVKDYTAAPVFMNDRGSCRHQWLIEFDRPPQNLETFAEELDKALQTLNSDYEAKRYKNLTLQRLEVIAAPKGLFDLWLKSKGKLGGQHKVPRLCNDRRIMDEVLGMM